MVPTRINLKLIKCEFWLNWIEFIYLFLIKNVFLYGILSALLKKNKNKNKNLESKRYDPQKNSKNSKKKKAQKTLLSSAATWIAFLAWKILKFSFLYFWKNCRELNFLLENTNPEVLGIFRRKLWPKYESGDEDNTNSTSSSIFFQNFKWESTSNLFKFI